MVPLLSLLSLLAAAAGLEGTPGCALDPACLTGVASTIGYFEQNPGGRAQHLTCSQIWSAAVASNCGPRSIHHRCPASAGAGGAVAWLSPEWRACSAAVVAAGRPMNASVCEYAPLFLEPHSLHSDMAVLQAGRPCFTGVGVPGDAVTVAVAKDPDEARRHGGGGGGGGGQGGGDVISTATTAGPVAADGFWRVCLAVPIAPALGNHTVRFSGSPSGSTAVNKGVLVGNVIVCSGQSNMEKAIGYAFNATASSEQPMTKPKWGTLLIPRPMWACVRRNKRNRPARRSPKH